jgi:hypothetical protein
MTRGDTYLSSFAGCAIVCLTNSWSFCGELSAIQRAVYACGIAARAAFTLAGVRGI